MMNDLLPEFEQQFASVTAEITSKTCQLLSITLNNAENVPNLVKDVHELLKDAEELLERMGLEVRDAPQDQRERLSTRIKSYETELRRLEAEFKRAGMSHMGKHDEESNRAELFDNWSGNGDEQRQTLLNNGELLERSSVRLDQSYKAALDSEQVGAQVLNDLQHQKETLRRARTRLHETDDDLSQSTRLLNAMTRRIMQNKFIVGVIVFVLAIFITLFIYFKFIRS